MVTLIASIIKMILYTIYFMILSVYSLFRIICWPILGRPTKKVEKIKYIDRVGPDISVKPQTFVNRLWSRLHDDDKLSIKSDLNAKSAFRLGIIMSLESVGTDPKLVESIAEYVELK